MQLSIDVANAFNCFTWEKIRRALARHRMPSYLRRIMSSHLWQRYITYSEKGGHPTNRKVAQGHPLGSVIGALLRNIGFNSALDVAVPDGIHIV